MNRGLIVLIIVIAAAIGFYFYHKNRHSIDGVLDRMQSITDGLCACKDFTCMQGFQGEMKSLARDMRNIDEGDATSAEINRGREITRQLLKCMSNSKNFKQ